MACKVKTNRHGFLAFRLYWNGLESWEGTGLTDTPRNRKRVEARAELINEEMEAGTFDYLKWFPEGNKARLFKPEAGTEAQVEEKDRTVREYYEEWIETKKPPLVRKSLERDYRQSFTAYILPQLGDLRLIEVTTRHLDHFRTYLLEEKGIKLKSARNIIDGPFRAMMRDAREVDGLPLGDPFKPLQWPRVAKERPDPFTEEERDKILDYLRRKAAFRDYAFVHTLFWTGMRPSEALALRWGDVDLSAGRIEVTKSRHLGEENAPKTQGSQRSLSLLPNVMDVLNQIKPLQVTERDYVFTDAHGRPIDLEKWAGRQDWYRALRACAIRPRKFYATRHAYISMALSHGVNIKWIAEQCGTSVEMIEKNYGRFIRNDGDAPLRALFVDQNRAKTETFAETYLVGNYKGLRNMVVPTGIEPVLPT